MFRTPAQSEPEKKPSSSVCNIGIFSDSPESKHSLINKLNTKLINLNVQIDKMDPGPQRKSMKYLLSAASFEDPYQLELMTKTLDEELERLRKKLPISSRSSLICTLCAFGASITSLFFSLKEEETGWAGKTEYKLTNNSPYLPILATFAGAALTAEASAIESKISHIKNMQCKILELSADNQKLARLLDANNPHELNFRQYFYEKFILPENKTEKKGDEISYTEWDLSKSLLIPSKVGFASRK